MASQSLFFLGIPVLLLSLTNPAHCCYKAIFSFGDSLADTGNKLYSVCGQDRIGHFPYGMTYFHKPTGRYSDGRIILDFIASAFGLPMVPPYLPLANISNVEVFQYGVNFAVGGATALDNSYFINKGMEITWTEYSLSAQIREFKQLLPRLSTIIGSDSSDILSKSLVILGEIGGNDYIHCIEQTISIDEMKAMAPSIISPISSAINTMIELGATVILAPGVTPFGCVAFFLSKYQNSRAEDYDQTGCLKWLNELAVHHNDLLKNELDQIRNRNPHITIIYADYYNAAMNLYQHPEKFGFEVPVAPCFGRAVCSDPSVYVCWDGVHFTDAAYNIMANGLLEGAYADSPLSQSCSFISAY